MANNNRLYKDRSGNIFIPMNVEGSWNEHFITTAKLVWMAIGAACGIILYFWLSSIEASALGIFIFTIFYLILLSFIFRYAIFQERYYYRVYNKMKKYEISTPAIFWDIASIKKQKKGQY